MATIRPLTGDDLPEALAINEANVPAVGSVDADQLAHLFDEASVALAAEDGGRLIGFCIVLAPGADYGSVNYGWFSERYDDFAYLDRVAVAESYRNRGIGAELYAEVERLVDARVVHPRGQCATTQRGLAAVPRTHGIHRGRSAGNTVRSTRVPAGQAAAAWRVTWGVRVR